LYVVANWSGQQNKIVLNCLKSTTNTRHVKLQNVTLRIDIEKNKRKVRSISTRRRKRSNEK
jgi:hypothetical protein